MNQDHINERLQAIGLHCLRVMSIQAASRLSGEATGSQINAACAEMVLATRLAGKTLRELSGAALGGDPEAGEQLGFLLSGKAGGVRGVLNLLNDGHLALNFSEPAETLI